MRILGRIGQESAELGSATELPQESSLNSLYCALTFLDEIDFVEIVGELRGALTVVAGVKNQIEQAESKLLINSLGSISEIMPLRTMDPERQYFVSKNLPLKIESHNYMPSTIGMITKHCFSNGHGVWIHFGFRAQGDIDTSIKNRLHNASHTLAQSGFELMKRLCCLESTCNPLGLKSLEVVPNDMPDAQNNNSLKLDQDQLNLFSAFAKLTDLEMAIVTLMADGKSNPEIAAELFVSLSTIRNTSSAIYNKIGARNRQQAVGLLTLYNSIERELEGLVGLR